MASEHLEVSAPTTWTDVIFSVIMESDKTSPLWLCEEEQLGYSSKKEERRSSMCSMTWVWWVNDDRIFPSWQTQHRRPSEWICMTLSWTTRLDIQLCMLVQLFQTIISLMDCVSKRSSSVLHFSAS